MSRPRIVPLGIDEAAAKARWPAASSAERRELRAFVAASTLEAADRQYRTLLDRKERRRQERAK
jgi:uncharacterized membrane protein